MSLRASLLDWPLAFNVASGKYSRSVKNLVLHRSAFLNFPIGNIIIALDGKSHNVPVGKIVMLDTDAIGKIVREERKALGLRQAELAAASGVGVRFLVDLERGKPTVQLGRVLAVLAALGCSIDIRRPQ